MNWIENVYVSEQMQDVETVLYSLKKEIPVLHVYLIAVEQREGKARLVTLSSVSALRRKETHEKLWVVGVAFGPIQALRLLVEIIADAAGRYGTVEGLAEQLMKE